MADPEHRNETFITELVFLEFGNTPELQHLLFLLFLMIYLATVVVNILIIVLVVADQQLHTPMYFFLGNMSSLETCYSSTILPSMLARLLTDNKTISIGGCVTQYYFFCIMLSTECLLLLVMSYDRYLAIVQPLYYAVRMGAKSCLQLVGGSWIVGILCSSIATVWLSQLNFCGPNSIDHFFCDLVPLMQLSCKDSQLLEMLAFTCSLIFLLVPFLLTVMSYISIIATILRIPSNTGRQKAFTTCSSHIIVVSIFYGTLLIVYMFPTSHTLKDFKKVLALIYTVLTPLVNPLIYSLRNKEVKEAMRKMFRKFMLGKH